jgi:hypothetical protein
MMRDDVIEESSSPWSSPIVLVKKKDGSTRFCVDYRRLNSVTRKDAYPLPRMEDILDSLSGATAFSTIDMASGYWQCEVAESDREKTAFTTGDGLYQFKVLPFGLCNGPSTFQRLMDLVLSGAQWKSCLVYLDDVIIFGRDFREHIERLTDVLVRLRKAGLKVKPEKCQIMKPNVKFLGHVVSKNGVATDPKKLPRSRNGGPQHLLRSLGRSLERFHIIGAS